MAPLFCVPFLSLCLGLVAVQDPAPKKDLPRPGRVFRVGERTAFTIEPPAETRREGPLPWVWYAPTLGRYPGPEEGWMIDRFLAVGIALAGIDVGESYGSPRGREDYEALYRELCEQQGFGPRPVLLARSRGGLMLYSWAAEHPTCVGGIAGIYPVCDLRSYPGLEKAAPAYGMSPEELAAQLERHNPIDRLAGLAKAKVPILHLHGDADTVVPLPENSAALRDRYRALGGEAKVVVFEGFGHDGRAEWFQSQELVDFVIEHALAVPHDGSEPESEGATADAHDPSPRPPRPLR